MNDKKYSELNKAPYDGSALYSAVLESYYDDVDDIREDVIYNMVGNGANDVDLSIIDNLSDNDLVKKFKVTMTKQIHCQEIDVDSLIDTSGCDFDGDIEELIHIDILDKLEELNALVRELPSKLYEDSYVIPIFLGDTYDNNGELK